MGTEPNRQWLRENLRTAASPERSFTIGRCASLAENGGVRPRKLQTEASEKADDFDFPRRYLWLIFGFAIFSRAKLGISL